MTRLTVEFTDQQTEFLASLAKKQSCTKAQLLRRALALLSFYEQEVSAGRRFGSFDADGNHLREVVSSD